MIFILVSVLLSLLVYWINRSILRVLGGEPSYAAEVVERIAAGDLSHSVTTLPGDNISLLHEMEMMRKQLITVIEDIRAGAEVIDASSGEVIAGNSDLSSYTERQATALEKTSASMEEITSTVKQNADNTEQARHLAHSALGIASRGGEVMREVNDTMDGISESSDKNR
ncbi:hypothetical protein OS21_46980 [Dickeya oryzae]